MKRCRFQMGTPCLRRSMSSEHAANASARCGATATTTTATSPTGRTPTRWTAETRTVRPESDAEVCSTATSSQSRARVSRAVGGAECDLELLESRTLDGRIQELIYRPTLHAPPG